MFENPSLNLLPPEDYTRIGYIRLRRFFTLFHGGIALVLLVGISLALPTYFFLFFQNRSVSELVTANRYQMESAQTRSMKTRINEANEKLRRLEKEYQLRSIPPVTLFLQDIVSATPAGILLTHLSFQKDTSQITLRGTADTRNNLLQFTEAIRNNPSFAHVESPIENILRERNFSFTLSFTIKNTQLGL